MTNLNIQHFIDIKQLSANQIEFLLNSATNFLHKFILTHRTHSLLQGQLIANLFFEPSTRTSNSFTIAAQRLGALTISPNMQTSSLLKGETLADTILAIEAMGAQAIVLRHQDNGLMSSLTRQISLSSHIINAGEGSLQHPTQALLDLMTIRQSFKDWLKLRVAIVGDLKHSRVASSLIDALSIVGVTDIRLVSPQSLKPAYPLPSSVRCYTNLKQGLIEANVIVCLRLQRERISDSDTLNRSEFYSNYAINRDALHYAHPSVIVMHPGPINRNNEITSQIADSSHSMILRQVRNGVAVRMAIMAALLS